MMRSTWVIHRGIQPATPLWVAMIQRGLWEVWQHPPKIELPELFHGEKHLEGRWFDSTVDLAIRQMQALQPTSPGTLAT